MSAFSQGNPDPIDTFHCNAGFNKVENLIYSQIFDQQSLQTYVESHINQVMELKSAVTNIPILHFFLIVEHDDLSSQTSKTDYGR